MLRTKYWKYFELEFLFSVNCINGFFGFGFVLGSVFHLIFWGVFSALWNQDCFYCSSEDTCILKPSASPPAASLDDSFKQRVEGRGWVADAPGDPSLYEQVVYEAAFQKSATAPRGGRGRSSAIRAKRGLRFPTDSPFVWSKSTFSVYRCPSTLTLKFLISPVQTLSALTPCKCGLCLMTS